MISMLQNPVLSSGSVVWLEWMFMYLLKVTLVFALGLGIVLLLRKKSASMRHLILLACFCSSLLMPVLSWLLPDWNVPLLPSISNDEQIALELVPDKANSLKDTGAANKAAEHESPKGSFSLIALYIWVIGAAIVALRYWIGFLRMFLTVRSAVPLEDRVVQQICLERAEILRIRRKVWLLAVGLNHIPLTVGGFRPAILVPSNIDSWSRERIQMVLAHELAHIKRWDVITTAMAQLLTVLLWFHPLVWNAVRHLYLEREHACDDMVLNLGASSSEYARHLLDIAKSLSIGWGAPVEIAMAQHSCLEGRLLSILNERSNRMPLRGSTLLSVILLMALSIVPLAAVEAWSSARDKTVVSTHEAEEVSIRLQEYEKRIRSRDAHAMAGQLSDRYFGNEDNVDAARDNYIKSIYLTWFYPFSATEADLTLGWIRKSGDDLLARVNVRIEGKASDGILQPIVKDEQWIFRFCREEDQWKIRDIYSRHQQGQSANTS